jgi:hypothetical protein
MVAKNHYTSLPSAIGALVIAFTPKKSGVPEN